MPLPFTHSSFLLHKCLGGCGGVNTHTHTHTLLTHFYYLIANIQIGQKWVSPANNYLK